MQIVGQTWPNLVTLTCRSWSEGQHGLYFTIRWFCQTIWCMNIIVWDNESVLNDIWPQNKYRSLWSIFHGPVIMPNTLKTIWCMNIIIWDYVSVWPKVWPQNKYRWLWLIFHGPVIFSVTSWRLFDVYTSYFGIMGQYGPMFDGNINVCLCDLYFMVHLFCLISPRLFDGWVSYFQTGPDSSVGRVSAPGNGRSRVRSRAATYQSHKKWY